MTIAERTMGISKSLTSIPEPQKDRVEENHSFYSRFYKEETNDSPTESRRSLLGRLLNANLSPGNIVLDLGAGRQILEMELDSGIYVNPSPNFKIITADIADITTDQLLVPKNSPQAKNYDHIQADGTSLPLLTGSIDAAISNMAIDFMPEEARGELFRVLKGRAPVFLNLHHPFLIHPDTEEMFIKMQRQIIKKIQAGGRVSSNKEMEFAALRYKKFLKEHNVLFESADEIKIAFEKYGFIVSKVGLGISANDKWWEVDMVKPDSNKA